jgi:hypothetical protein
MKCFRLLFILLLAATAASALISQDSGKNQILEVVSTTYNISRTETLVYLRVFSDGSAEAHPTRKIDFRNLDLKHVQLSSSDMTSLREFLAPARTEKWDDKYERFWGCKDCGSAWEIVVGQGKEKKTISLTNFQPFLAREQKKPYPADIEKLGCIVWELRAKVVNEPYEMDYLSGCKSIGY